MLMELHTTIYVCLWKKCILVYFDRQKQGKKCFDFPQKPCKPPGGKCSGSFRAKSAKFPIN